MRAWRAIPILALSVFPACVSTSHAKKLASAGIAYGRAMDALLRVTEESAVDADSARLLSEGQGISRDARREVLEKHAAVTETVADLDRLRRHARLLARYFGALGDLTSGDADREAADAIGAVASAVNDAGKALGASKLISPADRDALSQLARLTVRAARSRAIAKELETRASSIEQQLRIEHTVLEAIRRKLRSDLESVSELGLQRDVTRPYVEDAIVDPKAWIAARRAYLLSPQSIEVLHDAGEAAGKLRAAWIAFTEGRLDEAASRGLLSDLDSIVAFAEAVKAVSQ